MAQHSDQPKMLWPVCAGDNVDEAKGEDNHEEDEDEAKGDDTAKCRGQVRLLLH